MGMGNGFKSLKGKLLLDGGALYGSFFHRTVVLICHHDAEGAFGLVLNKISGTTLSDILVANLPRAIRDYPVYFGGPVQPTALSYIYMPDSTSGSNVMDNLKVGHSLDDLIDVGESLTESSKLKIFAGYAGWSPGQLDDEMRRKAWLTHPASLDMIFLPNPDKLWEKIIRTKGWKYRLLADSPEDLSLN